MDQVAPLFKQGPSAFARLFFFSVLGVTLLVVDTRFDVLRYVRTVLGTALYPVERSVQAPTRWAGDFFGYFRHLDEVEADNARLEKEKNALAQTALRAQALLAENEHLRK